MLSDEMEKCGLSDKITGEFLAGWKTLVRDTNQASGCTWHYAYAHIAFDLLNEG